MHASYGRIPVGREVPTIAGRQIVPGTLEKDLRVNQQIYDDIETIQDSMIDLMQKVLNIGLNPSTIPYVQKQCNELVAMINDVGIRYNLTDNFSTPIRQLNTIKEELALAPQSKEPPSAVSRYMLLKARLEVLMDQITRPIISKLAEYKTGQ